MANQNARAIYSWQAHAIGQVALGCMYFWYKGAALGNGFTLPRTALGADDAS